MKSFKLTYVLFSAFFFMSGIAMAERLSLSVPVANIRSGPGETYAVLWKVERYYPFEIIKTDQQWYRFRDFEGDQGWIHKSLVSNTPSVITIKDTCNVRLEPNTESNILFTVEKGIPFKIIKKKGDWIHIEHADGDTGWIHKTVVW
jgi:SH3-like domain-containing protein